MWTTLIKIHKTLQKIRPLRIIYNNQSGYFQHEKSHPILKGFIDLNLFCILVFLCFRLALLQSSSPTSSQNKFESIFHLSVLVVSIGLFSGGLATMWTFQNHIYSTIWVVNQSKTFNTQRCGQSYAKRMNITTVFEFIVENIVVIVTAGAGTIALLPLIESKSPGQVLTELLPDLIPFKVQLELTITVGTVLCMALFGLYTCIDVGQTLLFMCAVLHEAQFAIGKTYRHGYILEMFGDSKHVYQCSQIFMREYNNFGTVVIPLLMSVGMTINVAATFVCIKYHTNISLIMLGFLVGLDVTALILQSGIDTLAMTCPADGSKLKTYWKQQIRLGKLARKELKALAPIKVEIGSFFPLKHSTILSIYEQIVERTTSLLLMDN